MIKAENILQNRLEYFKNKEYEKIYDIYSCNSDFRQFFENSEKYKEHFNGLIEIFMPETIEIYKVLYNNESAEILFLEKVRDLKEDKLVYYYSKSYFVLEEGSWKILKEIRESTLNKGVWKGVSND